MIYTCIYTLKFAINDVSLHIFDRVCVFLTVGRCIPPNTAWNTTIVTENYMYMYLHTSIGLSSTIRWRHASRWLGSSTLISRISLYKGQSRSADNDKAELWYIHVHIYEQHSVSRHTMYVTCMKIGVHYMVARLSIYMYMYIPVAAVDLLYATFYFPY